MNRAERRRHDEQQMKNRGRKRPITIPAVVGMLESSTRLDAIAENKLLSEAAEHGVQTGQREDWRGESREVIHLSRGYSIGITLSAQILAGQAAELVLKFAYELDHSAIRVPFTHKLDSLYNALSVKRRGRIETDYAIRIKRHQYVPGDGWKTVEQVFRSSKDYPVLFRYAIEEGQGFDYMEPMFLREAIRSVLTSLGINVR